MLRPSVAGLDSPVIAVSVGVLQSTTSLNVFSMLGLSFTVIGVLISSELHSVSDTTKFME